MGVSRLPASRLARLRSGEESWEDAEPERVDLGTAWLTLSALLDPAQRADDASLDPSTAGGAAVVGWHPLPDAVGARSGVRLRYNTVGEVVAIAAALAAVDLEAELVGEASGALGYLVPVGSAPTRAEWDAVADHARSRFAALSALYRDAARRGEVTVASFES